MSAQYEVEVFYDGACPICVREMRWVRRFDHKQRIRFTDIAAPGFDPATFGRTMSQVLARIHGRLPSGEIIEGVEVFRRLYSAIGLGPLARISRLGGISHLLDFVYAIYARNRLRMTGRCDDGRCELPS